MNGKAKKLIAPKTNDASVPKIKGKIIAIGPEIQNAKIIKRRPFGVFKRVTGFAISFSMRMTRFVVNKSTILIPKNYLCPRYE